MSFLILGQCSCRVTMSTRDKWPDNRVVHIESAQIDLFPISSRHSRLVIREAHRNKWMRGFSVQCSHAICIKLGWVKIVFTRDSHHFYHRTMDMDRKLCIVRVLNVKNRSVSLNSAACILTPRPDNDGDCTMTGSWFCSILAEENESGSFFSSFSHQALGLPSTVWSARHP